MKLLLSRGAVDRLKERCSRPVFMPGQEPDGEIAFMTIDDSRLHELIAEAQLNHIFNLDIKTTVELIDKLRKRLDKLLEREMGK